MSPSSKPREAVHVLVSGIVQGVGFRYFTERAARSLGISGWVRNLHDQRVEAVAEGEPEALQAFVEQLRVGPRSAHVEELKVEPWAQSGQSGFEIRPTAGETAKIGP